MKSADVPSYNIVIGYHRDDFVIKSIDGNDEQEKLTPIHLGRSCGMAPCCDGLLGSREYHHLLSSMDGDTAAGEGYDISFKNRDYKELTATYLAYKNYGSFGNPDYIGIFQYKRYLALGDASDPRPEIYVKDWHGFVRRAYPKMRMALGSLSKEYDIYAPRLRNFDMLLGEYWRNLLGRDNWDGLTRLLHSMHPEYKAIYEECTESKQAACSTLLLCRKEVFFEYCDFIFPLLEAHEAICSPSPQLHAWIGDWLTHLFIRYKEMNGARVRRVPVAFIRNTYRPCNKPLSRWVDRSSDILRTVCSIPLCFFRFGRIRRSLRILWSCHNEIRQMIRINYLAGKTRFLHNTSRTTWGGVQRKILRLPMPSRKGCISPELNNTGLGNVLFCIAAAYAHALRHGLCCRVPWNVDFVHVQLRHFLKAGDRLPATFCGLLEKIVYKQKKFSYSPIPSEVKRGALAGLFQSFQYFHDKEEFIRQIYAPFIAPREEGTVGVQMRYGDYLNRDLRGTFISPSIDFIREAFLSVSPHIRKVVIFSNDEELAEYVIRQALGENLSKYTLEIDRSSSMQALRRLTAMEELILSASTFAWWGAYLGQQKKVIIPQDWFKVHNGFFDSTEGLYLPHWKRIPPHDPPSIHAPHRLPLIS